MRQELRTNGQTQTYGRLTRLRGAIEGAINGAVGEQAQREVATGISPEATMAARLRQESSDWQARRNAEGNLVGVEAGGSPSFSSVSGGQGAAIGRFGISPGNQGVQGQPTFDPAAAERLGLATQATRDRADTFGRGSSFARRQIMEPAEYSLAEAVAINWAYTTIANIKFAPLTRFTMPWKRQSMTRARL
jgi:hypothetical protein